MKSAALLVVLFTAAALHAQTMGPIGGVGPVPPAGGAPEQGRKTQAAAVVPQGSSLPGLGTVPGAFSGPANIEFGFARSELTDREPNWTDGYIRGWLSTVGSNSV